MNLSIYITNDTININLYNSENINAIYTSDYVLINGYFSKINGIRSNYLNLLNKLNNISSTGIDGNKILTQDVNFTNFNTLLSMIQSFHDTILTDISSTNQTNINNQLTILTKYNNNILQNLNFTT